MPQKIKVSVLDFAPVIEGGDASLAFRNALDLARHSERMGFNRFWMAEHHSMPGIASSATAVILAHIAAGTSSIRIGAGGIMLPNHSPLLVAEQFGTLEAIHPGRIDLGLGRAPGADRAAAAAIRRNLNTDEDQFPRDVVELMNYFRLPQPGQRVRAIPGEGMGIPIWILGSSLFGAELAATLGLPFAFASHFAPQQLDEAIRLYRDSFRPSEQLSQPYVMLGFNAFIGETDEEGEYLASSMQQAFIDLRAGRPRKLQPPVSNYRKSLPVPQRVMLNTLMSCSAIGSPETAFHLLEAFISRTQADELMITSQIYDHQARLRSFEAVAGWINGRQ